MDANQIFSPTTSDGCFADTEMQIKGFISWLGGGLPGGYSTLAAKLDAMKPVETTWPYARVADRMVQKLRKAGVIEKDKRKWKLTAVGQDFMSTLKKGV